MENRRQPTNPSTPFNRDRNFRREGDNKPQAYNKFQPRDQTFQPRGDRFQRNDSFQPRDGKFVKREGSFTPQNNRFQPNPRFQPRGKPVPPWKKEINIRIVSELQVTDGKHKGKYLKTTTSPKMQPTVRRIRETIFKILFRRVRARRFLDLCAGAGMIGIEAISRGAIVATMVERSSKMCSFIKKNLESCEIKEGHGEVVEMEAVPFLKKMSKRRRFWDVVYLSPPFGSNYDEMMKYFSRGTTITPGGVLVFEHHSDMFFPEKIGVLKRFRIIVQGETSISFYERKQIGRD